MSIDDIFGSMRRSVNNMAKDLLPMVTAYVKKQISDEYKKVGTPINIETGKEMEAVDVDMMLDAIDVKIEEGRCIVYIKPGTEADKQARILELFGEAPWRKVINMMKNPDILNRILSDNGINGAKAR